MTSGNTLRLLRVKAKMTQAKLAELSGVLQPEICKIEKGAVTMGLERAEKLGRALGVHPSRLLWPETFGKGVQGG